MEWLNEMKVKILKSSKIYWKIICYCLLVLTYLVLFLISFLMVADIIVCRLHILLVITTKNNPIERFVKILIPDAAEFAGIEYFKMKKFENVLNLQFLKKSIYYKDRGGFYLSRNKQSFGEKSRRAAWRNIRVVWENFMFTSRWTV